MILLSHLAALAYFVLPAKKYKPFLLQILSQKMFL